MTTFERLQRFRNLNLSIDLDKIKEDSHLFNDLNFDSLDAIEMILEMEEEFDIEIPDDIQRSFIKLKKIKNNFEKLKKFIFFLINTNNLFVFFIILFTLISCNKYP